MLNIVPDLHAISFVLVTIYSLGSYLHFSIFARSFHLYKRSKHEWKVQISNWSLIEFKVVAIENNLDLGYVINYIKEKKKKIKYQFKIIFVLF